MVSLRALQVKWFGNQALRIPQTWKSAIQRECEHSAQYAEAHKNTRSEDDSKLEARRTQRNVNQRKHTNRIAPNNLHALTIPLFQGADAFNAHLAELAIGKHGKNKQHNDAAHTAW